MQYKPVSDHDFQFVRVELVNTGDRGMWSMANQGVPIIGCNDCGGLVSLDKNHTIAEDGKVSPSIGCPWCGWHVFGKLLDWKGGHHDR